MGSVQDPNQVVGALAVAGLLLAAIWQLTVWVRNAPITPDPWDAETERQVQEPEAVELCHRCFTPQSNNAWFCPHCGAAVGPYNNAMPYVSLFSEGEVLRNGITHRFRSKPLVIVGYVLFSLSNYLIFAPIYWFFLFKNLNRHTEEPAELPEEGK
jgi:hypothetical protein